MSVTTSSSFLAFDLGAESGRAVVGRLEEGGYLRLKEIHRFSNGPVRISNNLFWDILHLWREIQRGLEIAELSCGGSLVNYGLDSWGVDFGLLAKDDTLMGNPFAEEYHGPVVDTGMPAVLAERGE